MLDSSEVEMNNSKPLGILQELFRNTSEPDVEEEVGANKHEHIVTFANLNESPKITEFSGIPLLLFFFFQISLFFIFIPKSPQNDIY